jgi:hypothetical protein
VDEMKQERNEYFTEEELEAFVHDIETNRQFRAPDYLTDMIMNKAERQAVRESVEIIPIRNTIRETFREGKPALVQEPSKQKQLLMYSIKIVAAAAAAIALIVVIPTVENHSNDQAGLYQVQYDQTGHREEKSIMQNLNEKSSDFCNKLFESTNQLFHREDK